MYGEVEEDVEDGKAVFRVSLSDGRWSESALSYISADHASGDDHPYFRSGIDPRMGLECQQRHDCRQSVGLALWH